MSAKARLFRGLIQDNESAYTFADKSAPTTFARVLRTNPRGSELAHE